jgi:hypothetical protein
MRRLGMIEVAIGGIMENIEEASVHGDLRITAKAVPQPEDTIQICKRGTGLKVAGLMNAQYGFMGYGMCCKSASIATVPFVSKDYPL